jgi:mono/diheme cytochrome c family protein
MNSRISQLLRCTRAAQRTTFLLVGAFLLAGCHTDMWVQPKHHDPLQESTFYSDGQASRPLVANTIPREHLRLDEALFTGYKDGKLVEKIPAQIPVTKDLLLRGQDRFRIYCTPCHGQLGDGQGMIAHRGFTLRRPVGNYHTDRLRKMPIGHFYDVITNGYGAMFSYAARIEPQDRWAVAAYIRALQLSQHAATSDADPKELENAKDAIDNTAPIGVSRAVK